MITSCTHRSLNALYSELEKNNPCMLPGPTVGVCALAAALISFSKSNLSVADPQAAAKTYIDHPLQGHFRGAVDQNW